MLRIFLISTIGFLIFLSSYAYASVTDDEIVSKIEKCWQARTQKGGNPMMITDFYCPSGDNSAATGKPYTAGVLAYEVAVAVLFQDLDTETMKTMKTLQESREKDPSKWTTTVSTLISGVDTDQSTGLKSKYGAVCGGGIYSVYIGQVVTKWLATRQIPSTMNEFPEAKCNDIANKKVQSWDMMAKIIASKSISKSYQNDSDRYMNQITTVYDRLLGKWNVYKRVIAQGVSKFTAFITNAVKP